MQTISEFWRSDSGALIGVARARGWRRVRGLIASRPPGRARALLFTRCRCVHGLLMGFPVDVVFLDRSLAVLRVERLLPWRIAACARAAHALELRDGEAARLGLLPGDRLTPQAPTTKGARTQAVR
ncbi:MAG: DUF192 domain-containing protein [Actinobacteria bacterium]|nr:DUF192 domain-containing protein [Actinomycetota bacterium]